MEDDRRREIALFRYALIRPLTDDRLSAAERGRLIADLAARPPARPGRRLGDPGAFDAVSLVEALP